MKRLFRLFPIIPQSLRKPLELIFKAALVILAAVLLYQRLDRGEYEGIFSYQWQQVWLLVPLFIWLWAQNLFLDAAIWQKVHRFLAPLTWKRALKTNMICYALSFITPVNSGELAGRYMMLNGKNNRQKTVFLTFWSHFPRLIIKFILGGTALFLMTWQNGRLSPEISFFGIAVNAVAFLSFYFLLIRIQRWLHTKGWRKLEFSKYVMNDRPGLGEKLQLFFLALVKYLTYNFQFIALLLLWGAGSFSAEMFWSVIVFYFVSALVPTFAAADFLIKGALAIFIFDPAIADESLLINAAFVVWAFNVALPALGGTAIIFKTNLGHSIKKRFSHGNLYGPER